MTAAEEPEIFSQLTKVLRARNGDGIIIQTTPVQPPFFQYEFIIEELRGKELVAALTTKSPNENELSYELNLLLCLPNRPDKLDMILQKAVELGASKITLLEAEFSQFKHQIKAKRSNKIMQEAAEQSERAIVPKLVMGGTLKKYLSALDKDFLRQTYVAMEREENKTVLDLAENAAKGSESANLLIGPEGGFSESEKNLIKELGIECFTLGKTILRMETAAILSLGIFALVGRQQKGPR